MAELFAIKKSAQYIVHNKRHLKQEDICIYVDSQAAIASLAKVQVESKLLMSTQRLLNAAAKSVNKLTIRWVKAHASSAGNHQADRLANEGRHIERVENDQPGVPWSMIQAELAHKTNQFWNWAWGQEPTCRQTKQWFPKTDPQRSHKIMQLNKNKWGKLCQFITGHNSLNRHLVLTGVDPELEAECSLCNEDEMTSAHIMGRCPLLVDQRSQTTGFFLLEPPFTTAIGKVLRFMHLCGLMPLQWQ